MKVTAIRPPDTPSPRAGETFTCCETPLAWPTRTEDRTCPECGTVWEHDGVDLGAGARIKPVPAPQEAGPTGHHVVAADRRAYLDAQWAEHYEADLTRATTALYLHRHGVTSADAFRQASAHPQYRPFAEALRVLEESP